MLEVRETTRPLPFYRPVPLTNLPLIYHPEHLFPYTSYGETAAEPVSRNWRMIVLENEFLRVEVAPDLGGRVYSLFDKRIDQEILFSNPVVKSVRILPIWAFLSGGIEFNFPIAHSPTSLSTVGCQTGRTGHYAFVRVGEREARTGMEWAVELGLCDGSAALIQRTALRNATTADHPWMMWTIAAVRSTAETEFIHSPHRVLVHDDGLSEQDWPGPGLNWDRNFQQMTALFWKPGGPPGFGAFHHELGCGLMHWGDPRQLPGKKVWTYGYGRHRAWGEATTTAGLSYAEIESGPLLDQSQKPLFPAGVERRYEEYWIPVHSRAACDLVSRPTASAPAWTQPWLGWAHSSWQREWEQFRAGDGPLPASVVPTGLDLEVPLRQALERGQPAAEPLALWLAFHQRPREALPLVEKAPSPTARRIAGLIRWKALHEREHALAHLQAGPLQDPVALVELDELCAALGLTEKRVELLANAPAHRLIVERKADLALARHDPAECLRLLASTAWPREHQRYVRTSLWQRAQAALGHSETPPPEALHEDNLAPFGAYWSE